MSDPRPALGVPGIYLASLGARFALAPERLDVAGFVGVAPRGPVDVPVAVHDWADYRWRFGGLEGPGLLPHAVRAFFAQGGLHAYVLRVSPVPRLPDPAAVAAQARHQLMVGEADAITFRPTGRVRPVELLAGDEGSWGRRLRVRWDFETAQRFTCALGPATEDGALIDLPVGVRVPRFSLLTLRAPGLPAGGEFAWAGEIRHRDDGAGRLRPVAEVQADLWTAAPSEQVEVGVVTVTVTVTDEDPALTRQERFDGLGLRAGHPRFVADVLTSESLLVNPGDGWPQAILPPDPWLSPSQSWPAQGDLGLDRWADIEPASFFDADLDPRLLPVGGVEETSELGPLYGMDRMALEQQIGVLAVPDLFWSFTQQQPTVDIPAPSHRGTFGSCDPDPSALTYTPPPAEYQLDRDTQLGETQLEQILGRQRRLVALAERQRRFVALLDVPRNLTVPRIARWRSEFDSSYAAAYHPWLRAVEPADPDARAVAVPPSAFAAGIIADREIRLAVPWGPANELAAGAVSAVETVTEADHAAVFALAVNVFRPEPDGWRLTSARTLSMNPDYLQLSVRRLMTMLRLVLQRQLQWLLFEPHSAQLRDTVRDVVVQLLRQLFRQGAFAGDSEQEAFFVRCDETLNPPWSREQGRLVAEIGVAPAQPLEFIVLRIAQDAQGALEAVMPS